MVIKMNEWKIEILRSPTEEDWKRCLLLARATQGKYDAPHEPSLEWKKKILKSEHSPIRTLMFTIKMNGIPYCNSVHYVRHKYGVEHYVMSQRKNPDRDAERQDAPVTHIMDINAQALINIARKRLCYKADKMTRKIMNAICSSIYDAYIDSGKAKEAEIWGNTLLPACGMDEKNCREFKPCGMYGLQKKMSVDLQDEELFDKGLEMFQNFFRKAEIEKDMDTKVSDMIHDLQCCAECRCRDCYRFIDEDEDGDNKYTALCSMALMTEAAELFEALQRMLEGLEKQ